ncbi:alpha,alpha-trehalose-phosphate synthase (UDP-forming) [Nitrococcus mobilis]|uniref:alpha,alpha-trehalose-phosphate synthase (UDP-forming) n=1 Tax=Nitrococcus mobilis TaxID=35797 RepID=UPI000324AAEB|nr:trehalose-6-phosphate synthase [Nitrococcus mobilis]
MRSLVVVSNRLPELRSGRPQAGGLAVALLGALNEGTALWFGWNGRISRKTITQARIEHAQGIELASVPLTRNDFDHYYLGYANEVLWPVFHFNLGAMDYRRSFAEAYYRVNRLFADALQPLLLGHELVWVHDYHLIPLGRELRDRGAQQQLGFFLHTPFPSYGLMRAIPDYRRLLSDLCAYDLLGFQTAIDRRAFTESVAEALDVRCVTDGQLRLGEHTLRTGVYPVSIDVDAIMTTAHQALELPRVKRLIVGLGKRDLVIGVDRLDYSKGLPQRFRAYDALLADYPHRRGQTVFMQIASPSRTGISEYDELRRNLEEMAGHINGEYAELDWVPVHYLNRTFDRTALAGLYRAARVGLVTPLCDGMNLVAKEFVAAQDSADPGVLVLSELAGAARELKDAVQVAPYDVDAIASGIDQALAMPLIERRRRHTRMLEIIRRNDLYAWQRRFLNDLTAFKAGDN